MRTAQDLRYGKIFYLSLGEIKINSNIIDGKVSATLNGDQYCDSLEDLISFINTHEVKGFVIVLTKDNLANKAGYVYTDYHYKHFTNNPEIYKLFSSIEDANICISQNHMETVNVEPLYKNPEA